MKKIIICLLVLTQYQLLSALQNAGIGTTTANASAQMDCDFNFIIFDP